MRRPGRWRERLAGVREALARAARAAGEELSARTVQFYGGCLLVGFAPPRLAVMGWILVVHAALAPLLGRREG